MAQMRKNPTASSGPRMTEAEATKCVKSYSGNCYPKSQKLDTSQQARRRRDDEESSRG